MIRKDIHITNLEEIVKEYLDKEEVDYIFQFSTRTGFIIDFAIPSKKVAIEVDGEKWHSSKEAMKRDRFKDYQLRREDWKVIRIKEEEINSLDSLFLSKLGECAAL